jgi:hypothetical protein
VGSTRNLGVRQFLPPNHEMLQLSLITMKEQDNFPLFLVCRNMDIYMYITLLIPIFGQFQFLVWLGTGPIT